MIQTMHILFVCHEYPPAVAGGIGIAVATLARGMIKAGHKVSVIGFYPQPASVSDDQGVVVYRLQHFRKGRLFSWIALRKKLRAEIVSIHKKDPIHVIEWPDFDGWWLTGVHGITDVLKLHGGRISHRVHGFGYRSFLYEFLELRMMRRFDNWIGVSEWFYLEWKNYSKACPARSVVVYNPVDTTLFKPNPRRDSNRVFYSGGLRKRKGALALARAAKIFLSDKPAARLMLATFESDVTYAEFLREVGPVAGQVQFLPFMDQRMLANNLAESAVFVMPSFYESCGNGWVEAMSSGVPVVGSTLSCGPEIVSDGVTGFLADPNNPQQIADKVSLILGNETLAEKLGRAGRQRALESFSLEVAVENSTRFYTNCCSAKLAH